RLPRLVGRNLAKELVLTGDMITAQRAAEIGLVNRVYPAAELMAGARETAARIVSRAPSAVRMAKMAMNRGLDLDLGNACALEASLFCAGFSTADRKEGIAAFLEKRKPRFTGE
ncbi:MAG: enoyl-CoA hydratase/isomerase family protein, partial [Verrucomicrobiota bacterium]